MDQPFDVGIVLQDLPPAEALHQVFDNLKNLDLAISEIFTRIAGRIQSEREKVAKVVQRVETSAVKVKQISENQSRVTTMYSTAKYPAPKILPDFQRFFSTDAPHPLPKTEYVLTKKQTVAMPASVDTSPLFQELTKNRAARADTENPLDETSKEGLGRLPAYFPSISSILLFNSDENPYKTYTSINNLEGVGGKDREQGEERLPDAPTSLLHGAYLPVFGGLGYEYKPAMEEMPAFVLPQNLPLGKIADIQFGVPQDSVQRIAPSLVSLPSLPSFPALQAPTRVKATMSAISGGSGPPPAPPSNVSSAPPPPTPSFSGAPPPPAFGGGGGAPEPPPMMAPPMDAPPIMAPPMMAPPMDAPPPMGGPPMDAPAPPPMGDGPDDSGANSGGGGGGAMDLMAAIRAAKDKKLRKVGDAVVADNKAKAPPPKKAGAEPMDMMSALKARVEMRRQAMLGKGKVEKKEDPDAAPKLDLSGGDDDGGSGETLKPGARRNPPKAPPSMSNVVLAAMIDNHKKKESADDGGEWDDND